jgi:beta-glucosidase
VCGGGVVDPRGGRAMAGPLRMPNMMTVAMLLTACTTATNSVGGASLLYKQKGAPVEQRVADIIRRMTLEEKVYQMLGDGMGSLKLTQHFASTGLGSMGWQVASMADLHNQNAAQSSMINSSRLGIPIDFTAETLHSGGHPGVTVFPMPALQGSSWNISLVRAIAASNALQARASGTNHGLSPVINVATDPVSEPAFLMVCTL